MSDGIEIEIHGLDQLKRALSELPRRVGDKAINDAQRYALEPMLHAAIDNAPRRTGPKGRSHGKRPEPPGTLKKNIILRRNGEKSRPGLIAFALVVLKRAYYARFLEFGTRLMSALPFMRPAYDQHKGEVPARFGRAIWPAIAREVDRLRR